MARRARAIGREGGAQGGRQLHRVGVLEVDHVDVAAAVLGAGAVQLLDQRAHQGVNRFITHRNQALLDPSANLDAQRAFARDAPAFAFGRDNSSTD